MHSQCVDAATGDGRYPCLKKFSDGTVVLLTEDSAGTVVFAVTKEEELGYYSDEWDESSAELLVGTIELRN